MAWIEQGTYTCIPGEQVANVPVYTTNQRLLIVFTEVEDQLVGVYGQVFLTGNEETIYGYNALIESQTVYYNPTLLTFNNPNLNGSFSFYRPLKAAGSISVTIYAQDGT